MIKANEKFNINYIDASSICNFTRCPAMYMMSRLSGLSKSSNMMMAADYGTDMHEALPYCYDDGSAEKAIEIFTTRWTARNHAFNDKRNLDCAINTIYDFYNSHKNCPYEIVQFPDIATPTHLNISKNELPFIIDIGGPLPLAGRIDAPVRWKTDNTLWALDYKTSGEVSQRFFNGFENSPQALAYTIALSQLTEERARGFIVEAIRVSKKNAESQMHMVFIKDCQIEHFIRFANNVAEQILECNEKQEWPMNCAACGTYSMFHIPGYSCDFLDVCTNPDKESMMKFYYKNPPWHPFVIEGDDTTENQAGSRE